MLPTNEEIERARREAVDLDFGDEPLDPSEDHEEAEIKLEHSDSSSPGFGRVDWSRVRDSLIAHRLSKGRSADGSKGQRVRAVSEDEAVTVTTPGRDIEWSGLPQSPRGFARRAVAKGWEVRAVYSATHYAATLFQADSKDNDGVGHARGDVRYPAEDREHWGLLAVFRQDGKAIAGFSVTYETRKAPAFEYARFHDPYSGTVFTSKFADFTTWLDILIPKPKKKETKSND